MTGRTEINWPKPESQLSLQHFRGIIRKFLLSLSDVQYALKEMYSSLFDEDLTIQPIDCREAADALEEMYTLVQNCSSLLDDASLLPVATLAPRYRLLFATQLVLDQTRRLIDLFNSYRVMCLKPSPQGERTYKKIQEVFQAVLKYNGDIPRQALYLEEESRLLEQDLIATLREEYA